MQRFWHALALLVISVSVSTADAAITFHVSTVDAALATGDGPQTIALADVNKDGRPDILGIIDIADGFDIFLNDGSGGFSTPPAITKQAGESVVAIASGDFNHDGNPDVVLVDYPTDKAIFLFGDGTGHFSNEQDVDVSPGPVAVAVADLDNDGFDDAAVLSDTSIYLIHSKGDGTFTPFQQPTVGTRNSGGFAITSGLLDSNAFVDLVVTGDQEAGSVSVLLGNGDGTFKTAGLYNVGAGPEGVVVAKLDDNASPDIAVADSLELGDKNVSRLYGNNDGTFQSDQRTTAEVLSVAIAAADFDSDGKVDLAVGNESGSFGVAVLRNDPGCADAATPGTCDSGFDLRSIQGFGDAEAIQAGDLNGDGKPDIVTQGSDGAMGVFINTTGSVPCAGDCDGSGEVTVGEIITMVNITLGDFPLAACTPGDADSSGEITVDEIITAVNAALTQCPAAAPPPDLVPVSVYPSEYVQPPYLPRVIELCVENRGGPVGPFDVLVGYQMSSYASGRTHFDGLGAGARSCKDTVYGLFMADVTIDPTNAVAESDETNNQASYYVPIP